MICTDRWKLIVYPQIGKVQLFDLASDPHELCDVSADPAAAGVVAELRQKLDTWQREVGDPVLDQ
jgi:arylsulfatase A-like enzyme